MVVKDGCVKFCSEVWSCTDVERAVHVWNRAACEKWDFDLPEPALAASEATMGRACPPNPDPGCLSPCGKRDCRRGLGSQHCHQQRLSFTLLLSPPLHSPRQARSETLLLHECLTSFTALNPHIPSRRTRRPSLCPWSAQTAEEKEAAEQRSHHAERSHHIHTRHRRRSRLRSTQRMDAIRPSRR